MSFRSAARNLPPSHSHHVIPSAARNLPPSRSVRGPRGMPTRHSREGENPEGKGGENHGNYGSNTLSHSEHSEESPPSHSVRGPGGCPRLIPRHSRAGGNPEGKGGENHGNHSPIMAIMVQQPKSLQPVISPLRIHTKSFRATPCHSEHSEESPPFAQRKGARGMPTRHSREGENPEGTGWENHGNHSNITAIMVQNLPPSHSHHVIPSAARNL